MTGIFRPPVSGETVAGSVGLMVYNAGQKIVRTLVPGPGIEILNKDGRTGDPTIYATPGRVMLGSLLGANLNSTGDQAIVIAEYPQYIITDILACNCSAVPTSAAGGVYTAPSKAGYTLVGASQAYTALTDASVVLPLTMGVQRKLTGPAVYLSLTAANGSACTADIYVFGYWLLG